MLSSDIDKDCGLKCSIVDRKCCNPQSEGGSVHQHNEVVSLPDSVSLTLTRTPGKGGLWLKKTYSTPHDTL